MLVEEKVEIENRPWPYFFLQLDPMLFRVFSLKLTKETPCGHRQVNSKIFIFCLITTPRYYKIFNEYLPTDLKQHRAKRGNLFCCGLKGSLLVKRKLLCSIYQIAKHVEMGIPNQQPNRSPTGFPSAALSNAPVPPQLLCLV